MSLAKYSPIARSTGGPNPIEYAQGHVKAEFRVTLAWHTTTGSPLLRYDRDITAPFLEDDSLFILEHFPLSATRHAYDFLDTNVGVATILGIWSFIVDTVLSLLWSSGIHNSLRFTQPYCLFSAQNYQELLQCDEFYSD